MTKKVIAKAISVLTLVPVIAAVVVTWLFISMRESFESIWWYIYSLVFLTIIPISAYPLKYLFPSIKQQGRKGERKLAFIMGVIGYTLGTIFCFILNSPCIVRKIFLAYLFSGLVLSFVNKVVNLKASGHACGISGPLTLLIYFSGWHTIWTLIILPIVYWARKQLGRHTLKELIVGTLVGIFSTILALIVA